MAPPAPFIPPREPLPCPAPPPLRLFLADLHLDGRDTPRARVFRNLLLRLVEYAGAAPVELYILGDLFEFWEEYHRQVAALYEADLAALESAHAAGVQIALAAGNRDFALGRYVVRRLGARLLGDGARVQISDARWLWLEHGDLLCTGDRRYLFYRKIIRSAPARLAFRLTPWRLARRFIERLAEQSREERSGKPASAFEPDLALARRRLEATACQVLLCGHTHRPQAEDLGAGYRLLVLPAWCDVQAGYKEQGGALVPVRFAEDGSPAPARLDGTPA